MKIKSHTEHEMVLAGTPGGKVWMVAAVLIGGATTAAAGRFAVLEYAQSGLSWPHLPLALGVLIGQAIFWTGAVTLAVGRQRLVLNRGSGRGRYTVVSPIVEAGTSFEFALGKAREVALEAAREERHGHDGHGGFDARVVRAVLRVSSPRRSVVLDETQNGREARVRRTADEVAEFLGISRQSEGDETTGLD